MTGSLIAVPQHGDTASKLREWSSVIGIVTAIIGNILISFALNIQRYAHIRLGQEQHAGTSEQRQKHKGRSYGTQQQANIAEDRVKANLDPTWEDGEGPEEEGEVNRRDEFMPSASLYSRTSSESAHLGQSEKSPHEEQRKSYLKSPYWWAGIVLMVIGEAGNFLAYGFAPASIVSPLGVVALVSNCIIAPCLLKERFRQRDFWGVTVAVAGAVVVVLSAKTSEPRMGPNDIWGRITKWEFELYLGVTAFLICALMWASGKYGHRTILIDLGLVGLYGKFEDRRHMKLTHNSIRWLHGIIHQRRCLAALLYAVARFDLPSDLPSSLRPSYLCPPSNPLRQSRSATLRLYSGHSHPIRTLHPVRHYWQHNLIP